MLNNKLFEWKTDRLNRPNDSHKGHFGRIAIIAGSQKMAGAACLTSQAAIQSGAGLVYLMSVEELFPMVQIQYPAIMGVPVKSDTDGQIGIEGVPMVIQALKTHRITHVAIGPGLGKSDAIDSLVKQVMTFCNQYNIPCICDADGLNAMSFKKWPKNGKYPIVITPHPKEFSRLSQETDIDSSSHSIQKVAKRLHLICVYKEYKTRVIDAADEYVNSTGNSGMATAGSGDVLTGIIVSFCAQISNINEAVYAAVYIHGLAGDICHNVKHIAYTAEDIIACIPDAITKG